MPTYRYVFADVFTDTPLQGNQLAVFTDARGLDDETMQALALEIGFSETVFVLPAEDGGTARIRIFNPVEEMRFAGHPVLGTAFVLGGPLQLGVIALETGVGLIPVTLERDESGRIVFGRMQQQVPSVEPVEPAERVLTAVGAAGSTLPVELYDNGARHIVVTLGDEVELASLRPDRAAIEELAITGVNCIAAGSEGWRNRMLWSRRGSRDGLGRRADRLPPRTPRTNRLGEEIVITQGVEIGRPSTLHARAEGGGGLIDAVEVGGVAVLVARGEFRL